LKKRAFLAISASVIILGVIIIHHFYISSTRNSVERLAHDKKLINIFLAGNNEYRDGRHKFFAVLSINPENNNIGLTLIPPSYRIRLNSSGSRIARIEEIEMSDFDKIKNTLYKDLKLNVPFYCELYAVNVERVVDLIGGISLFVLDQLKGWQDVHFGYNYFDGKKIMKYINSVEDNSVYLKYDRIQDIILTLYYKKDNLKKFNNIEFITESLKTIKTNLLPQEVHSLGDLAYKNGNFFSTMLPGAIENNYYITDDITYKIYEAEFLTPLIMNKDTDPSIKVKILNGTDVPGLARKVRNNLIKEGLNVVEFGTSPYRKMKKSIIICRKGNYFAVKKVAELTGVERIAYIIDNTLLYSSLLIIGEDLVK
jgi:anionic cell wall polymer biosynthesis LytR-Cps2A-Psr (LCP) family protein